MKISKVAILSLLTLLYFILLIRIFPIIKLPNYLFELLVALPCLNFAIFSANKLPQKLNRRIWFIVSEWIIGLVVIAIFRFLTSGRSEVEFWIYVVLSSIIGGILTKINFGKTFERDLRLSQYLKISIPVSLLFPVLNYIYFEVIYQKTFYDLSFFAFIPEIMAIVIWQIMTYKNLN